MSQQTTAGKARSQIMGEAPLGRKTRSVKGEATAAWWGRDVAFAIRPQEDEHGVRQRLTPTAQALLQRITSEQVLCRESDSVGPIRTSEGGRTLLRITTHTARRWTGADRKSALAALRSLSSRYGWTFTLGAASRVQEDRVASTLIVDLTSLRLSYREAEERAKRAKRDARGDAKRSRRPSRPRRFSSKEAPWEQKKNTSAPSGEGTQQSAPAEFPTAPAAPQAAPSAPQAKARTKNNTTTTAPTHRTTPRAPEAVPVAVAAPVGPREPKNRQSQPLTADRQALADLLLRVNQMQPRGARAAASAVSTHVLQRVVEAGPKWLQAYVAGLKGVSSVPAVLVRRFQDSDLAEEVGEAARRWVADHPVVPLAAAHSAWVALRAALPPRESASYLAAHAREQEVLQAILGLAEDQIGEQEASCLRAAVRRKILTRNQPPVEGSLPWVRMWGLNWRRALGAVVSLSFE